MFFETSAKDQVKINELFIDSTRKFLETAKSDPSNFRSDKTFRNPKGITIEDINERNRDDGCC